MIKIQTFCYLLGFVIGALTAPFGYIQFHYSNAGNILLLSLIATGIIYGSLFGILFGIVYAQIGEVRKKWPIILFCWLVGLIIGIGATLFGTLLDSMILSILLGAIFGVILSLLFFWLCKRSDSRIFN